MSYVEGVTVMYWTNDEQKNKELRRIIDCGCLTTPSTPEERTQHVHIKYHECPIESTCHIMGCVLWAHDPRATFTNIVCYVSGNSSLWSSMTFVDQLGVEHQSIRSCKYQVNWDSNGGH